MPERRCPVCRRPSAAGSPFCSPRCQLVDLGRWLGEEYRIPGPRAGDGAGERPAPGEEER